LPPAFLLGRILAIWLAKNPKKKRKKKFNSSFSAKKIGLFQNILNIIIIIIIIILYILIISVQNGKFKPMTLKRNIGNVP